MSARSRKPRRSSLVAAGVALLLALAAAQPAPAAIETEFIQRAWPKQRVRELEVGRYPVRWRQRASQAEGIFAGVRFTAPAPSGEVWERAADYHGVGPTVPGVTGVRITDESPGRQLVDVDAQVLWKTFTLHFEVEQEPPRVMRFRLVNPALGEFRGVSVFEPAGTAAQAGTAVDLSTWLKPAHPVPARLLLAIERMALLQGAKAFLVQFEPPAR